jgi:hypothetical protein
MKERRKSPLGDSGHVLNDKDDVTQLLIPPIPAAAERGIAHSRHQAVSGARASRELRRRAFFVSTCP